MLPVAPPSRSRRRARWLVLGVLLLTIAGPLLSAPPATGTRAYRRDAFAAFRHDLPRTVRADHPLTAPLAAAIRRLSLDPLEQLALVQHVTRALVDYDHDQRVYGRREFHATLDQMIARQHAAGWVSLRDDCDGEALFAAHLLAALDLPWRLEASRWKSHAWVSAWVDGVRYDLLDLEPGNPELATPAYRWVGRRVLRASRPPPPFAWRTAWRERTGADPELGLRLGLVLRDPDTGLLQPRHPVNLALRDGAERPRRPATAGPSS